MGLLSRLVVILGRRAFLTFGLVTFLVTALLATVNITSRYALKQYVDDQLRRIPWDLAIYQRNAPDGGVETITTRLASVPGIQRVESLAFLRARFPEGGEVRTEVGGKPLTTPWLSLLAASDLSLLPPEAGFALKHSAGGSGDAGAVLALVGPERAMGQAFLALQHAREFRVTLTIQGRERTLFSTPLGRVVRLDRDELNRWLMDQSGSVSYIPYVGVILLMPFREEILTRFDMVATGLVPLELFGPDEIDEDHVQLGEYAPEFVFLGRLDRARMISGWDIAGSLGRVAALRRRVRQATDWAFTGAGSEAADPRALSAQDDEAAEEREQEEANASGIAVDSTTLVLLGRMAHIARLVGIISLLVALPLLWMGWALAANLSGLLMLNERRTLGLMRLRGISGRLMGRALLISVVGGGVLGGVLGLVAGSIVPLAIYEGGTLPPGVLLDPRELLLLLAFLAVSLTLALIVSRRLVRYATAISPLEASGRVAASEAARASLRFGPLQGFALLAGLYGLVLGWILGRPLSRDVDIAAVYWMDRLLDFLGLPLFLYGVATALGSKRAAIQRVMAPLIRPFGGVLGPFAMQHLSVKPHRTATFLLIVALMTSVSLYPTITSRSFADKAERGARVQLGSDWQLIFNAPELVDVSRLRGPLGGQLQALRPEVERLQSRLQQVSGVRGATYLLEAVLPNFYLPGYGLKGVPLYLVGAPATYTREVYAEPPIGVTDTFLNVLAPLTSDAVAVSPPVADFWRLSVGTPVLVGLDAERQAISTPASGILAYLPGIPPRTVSDRQGYVQARIDYLNYLFTSNAYLVSAADSQRLAGLQLLIPRVIVLVNADTRLAPADMRKALVEALPFPPLEIHSVDEETSKVGTDMYISLALANMRIYLVGGLLLALIAILSIALANYVDDRRTLALLRLRGASPAQLWRLLVAMLLSPSLVGLILGGLTAVLAGFGLANHAWTLREIQTVVQLLPTRLVVSWPTGLVLVGLVGLLIGVATGFSAWVFRRTAHQTIQEA
jgi:hypothetical protein